MLITFGDCGAAPAKSAATAAAQTLACALAANADLGIAPAIAALRDTGASIGVDVETLEVRTADELPTVFAAATDRSVDAIMVFGTTLFTADRPGLVRLAERERIPALYPSRLFVDIGGMMDYGYVEAARGRDAAGYIAQILRGANPAELAMRPPSEFEVVLNVPAAERIGRTFPAGVLDKATDIIR